jgi:hypothetical protein
MNFSTGSEWKGAPEPNIIAQSAAVPAAAECKNCGAVTAFELATVGAVGA